MNETGAPPCRVVVTGTGRCGTAYMSEWLTANGIPCGHEAMFTYRGFVPTPGVRADSSWLAVPFLDLLPRGAVHVVHVVRHPLHVIRSFMGTRHFGPWKAKHYRRVWHRAMANYHGYTDERPIDQAMRYYVEWNARAEARADDRVRIEDGVTAGLYGVIAEHVYGDHAADVVAERMFATGLVTPPTSTNRHRRAGIDRIPAGPYREALVDMADRYGYRVET